MRPNTSWFTTGINAANKKRKKAEIRWRVDKTEGLKSEYLVMRNNVTKLIRTAKKTYIGDKVQIIVMMLRKCISFLNN